jgi:phage terminase small subunit
MSAPPPKPLTMKEARFVEEYLIDGNATRAAIEAGYARKSAAVTGSNLIRKPNVSGAIQAAREKLSSRLILTADQRRAILAEIANAPGQHPLARIKAIDVHNKMDGLYVQKLEHSGKLTLEQVLDASRGDE